MLVKPFVLGALAAEAGSGREKGRHVKWWKWGMIAETLYATSTYQSSPRWCRLHSAVAPSCCVGPPAKPTPPQSVGRYENIADSLTQRFQRRDCRIQEHFLHCVGCRWSGQDPPAMEALYVALAQSMGCAWQLMLTMAITFPLLARFAHSRMQTSKTPRVSSS